MFIIIWKTNKSHLNHTFLVITLFLLSATTSFDDSNNFLSNIVSNCTSDALEINLRIPIIDLICLSLFLKYHLQIICTFRFKNWDIDLVWGNISVNSSLETKQRLSVWSNYLHSCLRTVSVIWAKDRTDTVDQNSAHVIIL